MTDYGQDIWNDSTPGPNVTLDDIIERAEDWESYTERHPDAWQGRETANEILRDLLAWSREER